MIADEMAWKREQQAFERERMDFQRSQWEAENAPENQPFEPGAALSAEEAAARIGADASTASTFGWEVETADGPVPFTPYEVYSQAASTAHDESVQADLTSEQSAVHLDAALAEADISIQTEYERFLLETGTPDDPGIREGGIGTSRDLVEEMWRPAFGVAGDSQAAAEAYFTSLALEQARAVDGPIPSETPGSSSGSSWAQNARDLADAAALNVGTSLEQAALSAGEALGLGSGQASPTIGGTPAIEDLPNPLTASAPTEDEEAAFQPGVIHKLQQDYPDFLLNNGWYDADQSGYLSRKEVSDASKGSQFTTLQELGNVINSIAIDADGDQHLASDDAARWAARLQEDGWDIDEGVVFRLYQDFGRSAGPRSDTENLQDSYNTAAAAEAAIPSQSGGMTPGFGSDGSPIPDAGQVGGMVPGFGIHDLAPATGVQPPAPTFNPPTQPGGAIPGFGMEEGPLALATNTLAGVEVAAQGIGAEEALLDAATAISQQLLDAHGISVTPEELVTLYYASK
tara:strand:- start:1345 stop:2892 length:1548 start_codon:yes stop_codon:yes gene_type:complete